MVFGTQTKVKGDDIRGTDVPIEYVFIFAFFFIGTIGAFVFYQVKKARSSLPMAGQKRLDWLNDRMKTHLLWNFYNH